MGALPTLSCGGCLVTMTSRGLDAAELFETVERRRITTIVITGDAIARPLLRQLETARAAGRTYDLSSLRVIMSAGVAWSAEVKVELLEFMPSVTLQDACGSTEGGIGFRIIRRGDAATTNAFTPIPGLKVLREDGSETEPGEQGRIATPSVSLGYYKDPEKTASVFREIDGVTYVMAGDFAIREPDGSLILLGRGSTLINTGGEKVFPEEVEESVKTFPGVADCLVTGTPHERFGSQVTAVISLYDGQSATEDDIISHVRSRLASYKAPRRVVFVDEVPRHANGKADLEKVRSLAVQAIAEEAWTTGPR
jgi:fatty-acyl-CoA synthase